MFLDYKHEVYETLNRRYGKELADLSKCNSIYESIEKEKALLQSQLDPSSKNNSLGSFVDDAEEKLNQCSQLISNSGKSISTINDSLDGIREIRRKLKEYFSELNSLQCALQYIKVIQRIEFLNVELQREYGKKDDELCVTAFANLCEISRNLADFSAIHLKNHLESTISHWYKILKNKLSRDFENLLTTMKWPFVNANISVVTPPELTIQKFQLITEYLLQIDLTNEAAASCSSGLLGSFPPVCLPVQYLIVPLRKRFIFHFHGSKQTNRIDKPEWYLTQILTWIRDHREFVGKWVQPVIDKLGLHHLDAKLEFTRGLIQLAVEKLYSDISAIQYDDFTFSHTVDEALGFDKELREMYDYPANQPSVLLVLTQAQVFLKWLNMEKKYAVEKMDAMLLSDTGAFMPLASESEDIKVTMIADAFVTLLQTITDRYELLPQPGHRLQFLDLQLELLDDFRVRLLQLVHAEHGDIIDSNIPMIANTVYYIENVLIDWSSMLHFLNLYYYKTQFERQETVCNIISQDTDDLAINRMETESVFADTLMLYSHLRGDLIYMLSESALLEVKSKSKPYRREKWSMIPPQKDFEGLSLTPSASGMFEVLAKQLHQLQKTLTSNLFSSTWKTIAKQVDTFLFEDLILDSRFSEGGAVQLKFDVMRNLLPLFSQYTENPEYYFTQLVESCKLLNVSKGSALLLRETLLALEGATGVEDTRGLVLKEIGVTSFTPKMAATVLNQRTDITVFRTSAID